MKLPGYIEGVKKYLVDNGFPSRADSVVILGSGLGRFTSVISEPFAIPYSNIPGFPDTTVPGHSGKLITGWISGRKIIAFSGRFHHYEGHEFFKAVLPVHLAAIFEANKIIVSNAAGAINTRFKIGDLVVIDDIIRLFQKVSAVPSGPFRYNLYPIADRVRQIAAEIGLDVQRGTYVYVNGPNYESKAEIRAFRILGGDVVGMSTAPELIEASRLNIPAAAISLVTNMAAGVETGKLDHSEVKKAAATRQADFTRLVTEIIQNI